MGWHDPSGLAPEKEKGKMKDKLLTAKWVTYTIEECNPLKPGVYGIELIDDTFDASIADPFGSLGVNFAGACMGRLGIGMDGSSNASAGKNAVNKKNEVSTKDHLPPINGINLQNPITSSVKGKHVTSILIFGPTTAEANNKGLTAWNTSGIIGHAAFNVDGVVYEIQGDGYWHVSGRDNYINYEKWRRSVVEFTINVNPENASTFLELVQQNYCPQPYDIGNNSCVTAVLNFLNVCGVDIHQTNGIVTPEQLMANLEVSRITTSTNIISFYSSLAAIKASFVYSWYYFIYILKGTNPYNNRILNTNKLFE